MGTRVILKTPRLVLSFPKDSDEGWLQSLMEMPAVNQSTLVIPSPCPPGKAREWLDLARANYESGKAATFVAHAEGVPIGAVFLLINQAHSHAELGYFIAPEFWNQGFATEASSALLDYGFKQLGLHRIFAVYFHTNPASGNVMKKIGMKYEGCRSQHIRKCDTFVDIVQYGMLESDYRPMVEVSK